MKRNYDKLGHQAPRGWRVNDHFNHIEIEGDLHYCWSHDFVFNEVEEERKLYNAEPCYYTDGRYISGRYNFFHNCHLYFSRRAWGKKYGLSLRSCIRKTLKCRNIPVGTVVRFARDWYYQGKNIDFGYHFKIRKENSFDPKYEINLARYERNFDNDKWAQELTDALRANGFIVGISKGNPNFISGMLSQASEFASGTATDIRDEEGQIATAYGHGRMIGFSTGENSYRGYGNGCENVLYDFFGSFNKWSQCITIHKSTPIAEIIKELTDDKPDELREDVD